MKRTILTATLATSVCLAAAAESDLFEPDEHLAHELTVLQSAQLAQAESAQANEDALQDANRTVEAAKSQRARGKAGEARARVELKSNLDNARFRFSPGGLRATAPLVIRFADMTPATLAQLQEDMSVMSRILSRTVGREGHDSAMGIVLSEIPGSKRPQSLYLQDYGALFLLTVNFPLIPPQEKDKADPQTETDATWEQTRRELFGTDETVQVWSLGLAPGGTVPGTAQLWNVAPGESDAEYDADQVRDLKNQLILALKNATHIRDLKSEEYVTVMVTGSAPGADSQTVRHIVPRSTGTRKLEVYAVGGPRNLAGNSTMTLRVKKADIDAFAKGAIDLPQFQQKVTVSVY